MKHRYKFSLRSLFVVTAIVALVIGLLQWAHQMFSIDPASETVTVNAQIVHVDWTPIPWEGGHSGLSQPSDPFVFTSAFPTEHTDAKQVNQTLLEIGYTDHFGICAFNVTEQVYGWHAPDWSDYLLCVGRDGGGTVDGAFFCDCEFHEETRCLTIHVREYINNKRTAKSATFRFVHDGKSFRWQPDSDQRTTNPVGSGRRTEP